MNRKVIAIFLLALLLRLSFVTMIKQWPVVEDALQYDTIAANITSNNGFAFQPGVPTPARAPLYPLMLSLVYYIFGHSYLAVRVLQAFLGAATCVVIYFSARRIFNEAVALISSLTLCLYPVLIVYTGFILSETLFTFLLSLSVWLFIEYAYSGRYSHLILSAALLGLSSLTRPTTMLFAAVYIMALAYVNFKDVKGLLIKSILIIAVYSAVLMPWTVRNYAVFKIFLPVAAGGGMNIYATAKMTEGYTWSEGIVQSLSKWESCKTSGEYAAGDNPDIVFDAQLRKEGAGIIKEHKLEYLKIVSKRVVELWWSSHSSIFGVDRPLMEYVCSGYAAGILVRAGLLALHGMFLAGAVVGMLVSFKTFGKWLVLFLTLCYFNMHVLFDSCPRFALPAYPYIFIFFGVFAAEAANKLFKKGIRK